MTTLTTPTQTINQITINQIAVSLNEKDIENAYRQFLSRKISDIKWTSPFNCDGFGESENHKLRVLCEFKEDLDLTNKLAQVKVLSQAIYYIKKFEISGQKLPTTVLVADRNECFVIHANDLFKYLSLELNWSSAASEAYKNTELVSKMMEDDNINPHVFSIYQLEDCLQKLKDLTDGVVRLIPITPHNITEVFSYFEKNVLAKNNLNTNELANLFTQILINPEDNYLHPALKRKTIVTKSFKDVPLKSRESFKSFFSHFSNEYTPKQKEQLTAVVDRLIQDVTRRKQGEFFTPTIWVDKAHEYIASVFGDDWKEKYVVWDPAWGTGNLTRDYKFKELYVSTLNYSDIQTAEQMGYNPEAIKSQFDFLNDDYDFLPKGLRGAIESGKEIIVLINPPYKTSQKGVKKGNIDFEETNVKKEMVTNSVGKSSLNLYNQFVYRLSKYNVKICMFTPALFFTGGSNSQLRKYLFSKYIFSKGFLMDSSNFADVKSWGLAFSIFNNSDNNQISDEFNFDILDSDDFVIVNQGNKKLYNTDIKNSLSEWIKVDTNNGVSINYPHLTSALNVGQVDGCNFYQNSLGYVQNKSNNIYENATGVSFFSAPYSNAHGFVVSKENYIKSCIVFSVRKIINKNWINEKDEYVEPNETHSNYKIFEKDSIIYSLFNNSSNQSSLRQITYKEQLWDIKNEFFWMSKEEIMELANNTNYTELYNDARTDTDRYVHNILFGEQNIYNQLSDDAKLVLDKATELTRMSIEMRQHFADGHNHLDSWDAGYAQLKLVWKEYFPNEFKEFRQLYKNLEDRMRPLVYELGFLLK